MRGRQLLVGFLVGFLLLLVLAAVPACGDGPAMQIGMAMLEAVAPFLLALAVILVLTYLAATVLIEAASLNTYLKLGYWPCLRYAFLANVVSALLGAAWYFAAKAGSAPGEYVGWKSAFVAREASFALMAWMFLRSFIVTSVSEGLVLAPLLSGRRGMGAIVKGVVFANCLSYILSALVLTLLALR